MSSKHKLPTISFRVSPEERREIEAKIIASGMQKKDYFARSCIYNHVCVVGKKETIYRLVEELQQMEQKIQDIFERIQSKEELSIDDLDDLTETFKNMLKAILWMLDGAKYLWQGKNDVNG